MDLSKRNAASKTPLGFPLDIKREGYAKHPQVVKTAAKLPAQTACPPNAIGRRACRRQ